VTARSRPSRWIRSRATSADNTVAAPIATGGTDEVVVATVIRAAVSTAPLIAIGVLLVGATRLPRGVDHGTNTIASMT
jgi:hypothetical protein